LISMNIADDIILINKPKGITSFDCIRRLRKHTGIRKMGHAGTLDPLATGLMIIGINRGTKKLNEYLKLPKTYEATILLGKQTDSGDLDGDVIKENTLNKEGVDVERIEQIIMSLVGIQQLPVPKYSAIKKDGKPLYKYAREGKNVDVPVKEMKVNNAVIIDYSFPYIKVFFDVESGVYIRSLVEEFSKRINIPSTLSDLRRTRIGDFLLKDAHELPMIQ